MILYGVPSSFYLFFSCVYVVLSAIVPMHLQVVGSPMVGFLVVDLQRSVRLLVEFLKWDLQLDVSLGDLVQRVQAQRVQGLVKVLDWEVVVEMVNGQV